MEAYFVNDLVPAVSGESSRSLSMMNLSVLTWKPQVSRPEKTELRKSAPCGFAAER